MQQKECITYCAVFYDLQEYLIVAYICTFSRYACKGALSALHSPQTMQNKLKDLEACKYVVSRPVCAAAAHATLTFPRPSEDVEAAGHKFYVGWPRNAEFLFFNPSKNILLFRA